MFNVYSEVFSDGWADMVYRIAHTCGAKFESAGRGDTLAKGVNGVVTFTKSAVDQMICDMETDADGKLFCKTIPYIHDMNPQRNPYALQTYVLSLIKGTPEYEKSRENVYAYGIRLHEYPCISDQDYVFDQIYEMRTKLALSPLRRDIQAITFIPEEDGSVHTENPPCLQRISVRQISDDGGCRLSIDFRSNDAKAFIFNMVGIATMMDYEVMKPTGKYIKEIFYHSDNTHIYEDDWDKLKYVRPARIA